VRLIHRKGDSVPVQITARTDGGSWFLFVERAAPGAFDEHTDDAVRGQVRARTRRLEESRDRYRALVESLADGLVTLTPSGELLYLNRTFSEMLGHRARSAIVAKPFLDVVTSDDRTRVRRDLQRIERGEVARFETSLLRADGSPIAVLVAGRTLPRGRNGEARGLLLIITDYGEHRDITERLALASKMEALSTLGGASPTTSTTS
jgi:PAS domain S-box-containing protein